VSFIFSIRSGETLSVRLAACYDRSLRLGNVSSHGAKSRPWDANRVDTADFSAASCTEIIRWSKYCENQVQLQIKRSRSTVIRSSTKAALSSLTWKGKRTTQMSLGG